MCEEGAGAKSGVWRAGSLGRHTHMAPAFELSSLPPSTNHLPLLTSVCICEVELQDKVGYLTNYARIQCGNGCKVAQCHPRVSAWESGSLPALLTR